MSLYVSERARVCECVYVFVGDEQREGAEEKYGNLIEVVVAKKSIQPIMIHRISARSIQLLIICLSVCVW